MAAVNICKTKYNTEKRKAEFGSVFLNMLHLHVYLLSWCNFHIWEQPFIPTIYK